MIIEFILSVVIGLVAHQSITVTARMPDGWRNIVEHAVGVTATYPAFVLFRRRLKNGTGAEAAYWLAFLGVGIGVALGWLIDTLRD